MYFQIEYYQQESQAKFLEGKLEGELEAKQKIAKRLLKRGIYMSVVLEDTGLTLAEVQRIKKTIEHIHH